MVTQETRKTNEKFQNASSQLKANLNLGVSSSANFLNFFLLSPLSFSSFPFSFSLDLLV